MKQYIGRRGSSFLEISLFFLRCMGHVSIRVIIYIWTFPKISAILSTVV